MDAVLGYSATQEGRDLLKPTDVVKRLLRAMSDPEISYEAVAALVNLSTETVFLRAILDLNPVDRIMENLRDPECRQHELDVMLLTNLTQTPEGVSKLLQTDNPSLAGLHFLRLVQWFVEPAKKSVNGKVSDRFEHVGHILTNLTGNYRARDMLTDPTRNVWPRVVESLASKNKLRREWAYAAVRNCLFNHAKHEYVTHEDFGLVDNLILPLIGTEEYSADDRQGMSPALLRVLGKNRRETDPVTVKNILDCMQLLCGTKAGREALRRHKAYPVLREVHLEQTLSQDLLDSVENIVQMIALTEEEIEAADRENRDSLIPALEAPAGHDG
eukprot:GILK01003018.1.p1 GENE.GILK01003018.1~~GILK01003018.1.p1  ORF type:complete len:368 (-),score=47.89 GILK01003018.1:175-1161(-)